MPHLWNILHFFVLLIQAGAGDTMAEEFDECVIVGVECLVSHYFLLVMHRQTGLVGEWACPQEGLVSGGVCSEILAGFRSF